MYEQLCDIAIGNADPMWRTVWKLNVLERVRCFVWLLLHDRLLTNQRKSCMGLGHAMCSYCGNVEETSLHAIRDCKLATPFLLQLVPSEERSRFFMEDTQAWIVLNLTKGRTWGRGGEWRDIWAMVCHSLWMWRNKETHDEEFIRPIQPVNYVYKCVEDYQHAKQVTDMIGEASTPLLRLGGSLQLVVLFV
jgi:hypothetical protein